MPRQKGNCLNQHTHHSLQLQQNHHYVANHNQEYLIECKQIMSNMNTQVVNRHTELVTWSILHLETTVSGPYTGSIERKVQKEILDIQVH